MNRNERIVLNGCRERKLPRTVRQECIWMVKDYERLCELANRGIDNGKGGPYEIVLFADDKEGLIPSSVVCNAMNRINCIHTALGTVPMEYRKGIMDNIINRKIFNDVASTKTWNYWKDMFIKKLAKQLELW